MIGINYVPKIKKKIFEKLKVDEFFIKTGNKIVTFYRNLKLI